MDYIYFITFFHGVLLAFCSTDDTADSVYDILSSKIDNIHFDIRNMRNELNDITKHADHGRIQNFELSELKTFIETKIDERFENLEKKITQKVDKYLEENLTLLSEKQNGSIKQINKQKEELSRSVKKHVNGLRKTVSSEKMVLRNIAKAFAVRFEDSEQIIENITDAFKIKIEKTQQDLTVATNAFGRRIEDVEQKMFAFENASWKGEKGDKGDVGPPGPTGPAGNRGNQGLIGQKGEKGSTGYSGSKGQKGQKGSPGQREKGDKGDVGPAGLTGPAGNRGSQGLIGQKGEKGATSYSGSKGQKGQKGSPEQRKSVYFDVSFKSSITMTSNTIIKYDHVLNNVGSGYSKATGKFTAPYSGLYLFLFFVEVTGDENNIAFAKFYKNGKSHAYAIAEASHDGHDTSGGNAFVTYIPAGMEAWIQTGNLTGGNTHHFNGYGTTFSGVLLYLY